MTREEAIKFLTLMRKAVSNFEEYGHDKASMVIECDKAEAIDIAIETLSVAVSREDIIGYIDRVRNSGLGRNKALEYIRKYVERTESADAVSREEYEEVKEEYINTVGAILAVISAPSCLKEVNDLIEPLKVVRCKDCRWFKQDSSPVGYGYCDGRMVGREVYYNDFCSYGERQ